EEFPALDRFGEPKAADEFGEEGEVRCIGCHTSTPDGKAVAFVGSWPWSSVLASITEGSVGQRPEGVSAAAARILQQPWQGTTTFSKGYWGDRKIMLQAFGNPSGSGWPSLPKNATHQDRLVWFDLSFEGSLP